MITDLKRLSGLQKVAILFNILGEGLSITLLKELTKTDIRKVRSVARDMDSVSFKVKKQVIKHGHSSEIRGLCLMKCFSETLQNLPYFWRFSFRVALFFSLMNALAYVDIDQGIH